MSIYDMTNNAGWLFLACLALAGIALLGIGVWFAALYLLSRGKHLIRDDKTRQLVFELQHRKTLDELNKPALPSASSAETPQSPHIPQQEYQRTIRQTKSGVSFR